MKCHEVMRLLPLFLDSELSPEVTLGMEEHFEGCAGCRCRLESERDLEASMRSRLLAPHAPRRAAWDRALAHAVRPRPIPRLSRGGWGALAAGSALLAVIAVELVTRLPHELDLAGAAANDHARFLVEVREELLPPATMSQFSEIARRVLPRGTAVPGIPPAGYHLLKTGQCKLDGAPVVYLVMGNESGPVSVFLMPRLALARFPGFAARLGAEDGGVNCRVPVGRFFGRGTGSVVACAVGQAAPADLQQIVRWALSI